MKPSHLVAAVLLAASLTGTADARHLTLTYTGTLASGTDNTGVFGSDTDLTGETASIAFFIDTALGTRTDVDHRRDYIGGFFYPAATPVTKAIVTVGGTSHTIGFPIFGEFTESVPPGSFGDYSFGSIGQLSENQTGPILHFDDAQGFLTSASDGQVTPVGFENPFVYTAGRGDTGNATFTVFARDTRNDAILEDASGAFMPSQVSLTVGGVPEPASWALLVAGFGLVGTAARRARPRSARA